MSFICEYFVQSISAMCNQSRWFKALLADLLLGLFLKVGKNYLEHSAGRNDHNIQNEETTTIGKSNSFIILGPSVWVRQCCVDQSPGTGCSAPPSPVHVPSAVWCPACCAKPDMRRRGPNLQGVQEKLSENTGQRVLKKAALEWCCWG